MQNINLKLLHVFLLVAEQSSFRRAAERSHRSLSAVSMQIKQLESQLGVALLHRTTRRVELTNDGEHLLICARRALAELENGLLQIRESVDMQHGRLSISCVPTLAATRLPRILAAFQKDRPGIAVHVRELLSGEVFESVRRREVDFGVGPKVAAISDFHFHPLLNDEICALVPANYRLPRKKGISLEELSRFPILRLSTTTGLRAYIDTALKAQGLTLETKYEVMQVHTLIAMVEAGLGVAILPRVSVPANTGMQAVPIIKPALSREICIITLRGQSLSPAATLLALFFERLIGNDDPQPGTAPAPLRRLTRTSRASARNT